MKLNTLAVGFLLHTVASAYPSRPAKRAYSTHDYYVLEHDPRAAASPDEIATALGTELVGPAGELEDHFLIRAPKPETPAARNGKQRDGVMEALQRYKRKASSKRRSREPEWMRAERVVNAVRYLEKQVLRQRVKRDEQSHERRAPPPIPGGQDDPEAWTKTAHDVALHFDIADPEFQKQWHLVNDAFPEHSMNASGVWEMGITGEGIISGLVDDGLDYNSDDLAENFDAFGSYDFNDHVDLPTPVLFDDHHGTRCAGQIAAVKNNVCGVGVAYQSKVAGLRILSGPISDIDEAASLNYGYQNTSIYSCSWGPADDGRSMEAPGYLVEKAVVNGINKGRAGKGSVFVFAAGNGAANGDQCNFDGYTNSIYSITVAAVDYKGLHPYYSEPCAANMVVAYTSGSGNHIVTTDVGKNKCATTHGGTSAAAPNAVGVFALALSTRPDLTWRDMQHIAVRTAVQINHEDPDWEKTAVRRPFSYKYGYGKLDAYQYVTTAKDWKNVKPQAWMELNAVQINNGTMNVLNEMSGGEKIGPGGVTSALTITKEDMEKHNLETLEHVTVRVWIEHTRRGDVEVELVSPNGVKSILAAKRNGDLARSGFPGWRFMTLKHWDENPVGEWKIRVSDQQSENQSGSFLGWSMSLWGSAIDASQVKEYVLPLVQNLLPTEHNEQHEDHPAVTSSTAIAATSTKTRPKPTANLPSNHGSAAGEATKPAFTDIAEATTTASTSASASMTPTADEGWFSDMGNLVSDQKWFIGAVVIVVLFGLGACAFFWRRRIVQRRRAQYNTLATGDDLAMSSIERASGGPRTKELYDAFGEVSDDEDADEQTGLRPHDRSPGVGLGYHSGFLEDDEPPSAPLYRDEPTDAERHREGRPESPASGSGSGDGSWEHASQTR